mmetsp:Transcript_66296/g.158603  ORF Transcript_66296/g.158603 Transcript_66296/m.158603 type:complete len:478 (-) Transcript_66296:176-1609(-)
MQALRIWLIVACATMQAATPASSEFDKRRATLAAIGQRFYEQDLPIRMCAGEDDRPVWYKRPFSQARLAVEFSQMSPDASSWVLTQKISGDASAAAFCRWIRSQGLSLPNFICEDCARNPCPRKGKLVRSSDGTFRRTLLVPLSQPVGCVTVERSSKQTSRMGSEGAVASIEWTLDLVVASRIGVGLALLWLWKPLRESPVFHALLGSFGSLLVVVLVVSWWIFREMRDTVLSGGGGGLLPFGRSMATGTILLLAFAPGARETFLTLLSPMRMLLGEVAWDDWRDPFLNLPVGWLALGTTALFMVSIMVLGAHFSMQQLASPPDPEGDVPFVIASDGSRMDLLPPTPIQQKLLGNFLWLAGLALLLGSTHDLLWSCSLTAVALYWDSSMHVVRLWRMMVQSEKPQHYRPLVKPTEFDEQGKFYTSVAVSQLQSYLKAHPEKFSTVRQESELHLRRFAEGRPHCEAVPETEERRCIIL